eukprot:TRINITY_DN2914_c0_g1_i1.p1 TRINITY_DN2914_c0_g1~~TRINITY_DN2914_c0_g1_i1.p1  ORF type:complete len:245 (-),score=45.92 TRINITY_DN2914_c0_g1_i1:61-795(-)
MSNELINWLNNEVKLPTKITDINNQFKNGYLFKELFSKIGVNTLLEFQNKIDDQCIFQNYIYAEEVCEKQLGIKIAKSKSKSERAQNILIQIKEKLSQYKSTKEVLTHSKLQESKNIEVKFQKSLQTQDERLKKSFQNTDKIKTNISPKLLVIESKLQSFRDQRIEHEILAKSLKDSADKEDFQFKMEQRQVLLEKSQQQHEYIKQKTKSVSYTHLTLPTICSVQISVVAVSLKKKKKIENIHQ